MKESKKKGIREERRKKECRRKQKERQIKDKSIMKYRRINDKMIIFIERGKIIKIEKVTSR